MVRLDSETITYAPNRTAAVVSACALAAAAVCLVWVGAVLGPESRTAMDGLERLLFSIVPIRPFAWIMAIVFLGLSCRIGLSARRDEPTLVLSPEGLMLRDRELVPWNLLRSWARDRHGNLILQIGDGRPVALSSFDLGTDPAEVAERLARRVPGIDSASTEEGR